jgi:hypothetical protein
MGSCKAPEHEHGHGVQKIGSARLDGTLVLLAEQPIPPKPPKGPLDDPTLREKLEPLLVVGSLDHLDVDARVCRGPLDDLAVVGSVDPHDLKRGELVVSPVHEKCPDITILDVRRRDENREEQSKDINKDVALAPVDLFFPRRTRAVRQRGST